MNTGAHIQTHTRRAAVSERERDAHTRTHTHTHTHETSGKYSVKGGADRPFGKNRWIGQREGGGGGWEEGRAPSHTHTHTNTHMISMAPAQG